MKPVFILGPPRSGTTLVLDLLEGHPQISAHSRRFYTFHHNLQRFKSAVERPDHYRQTTADVTDTLRREYIQAIEDVLEQDSASIFVLKISTLSQQVDYLRTLFPDARFIQLVRDARDSICSMESLRQALEKQYNQPRALGPAADPFSLWSLQNTNHPHLNAACAWHYHITRSWLDRVWTTPENYLRIRYEDLVATPRTSLELMADFLSLDIPDTVQPFLEQIQNAPQAESSIGFSITQASGHKVARYQQELSESVRTAIAPLLELPMALLGYEPDVPQDEEAIIQACNDLDVDAATWLKKITAEAEFFQLHKNAFAAHRLFRQDPEPEPDKKPLLIDCALLYSKMLQIDGGAIEEVSGIKKQDRQFEFPDEHAAWPTVAPLLDGTSTVKEIQDRLLLEEDFVVLLRQLHQRGFLSWAD